MHELNKPLSHTLLKALRISTKKHLISKLSSNDLQSSCVNGKKVPLL